MASFTIHVHAHTYGGTADFQGHWSVTSVECVRASERVAALKERVFQQHGRDSTWLPSRQRLYHAGVELSDESRFIDVGITAEAVVLVALRDLDTHTVHTLPQHIRAVGATPWPTALQAALAAAQHGFELGYAPELAKEGQGGTYFLRGDALPAAEGPEAGGGEPVADRKPDFVACFKPRDEEHHAPNNPKNRKGTYGQATLRAGVYSGECYAREVAAFMLDHGGFSGVPPTALAQAWHSGFNNGPTGTPSLGGSEGFPGFSASPGASPPPSSRSEAGITSSPASSLNGIESASASSGGLGGLKTAKPLSTGLTSAMATFSQSRTDKMLIALQPYGESAPALAGHKVNELGNLRDTLVGAPLPPALSTSSSGSSGTAPEPSPNSRCQVKVGSFQAFVKDATIIEDYLDSIHQLPVEEVQKVALLDLRLLNADRNTENILVVREWRDPPPGSKFRFRKVSYLKLIPIDHGYTLGRDVAVDGFIDWCWTTWPQVRAPMCEAVRRFIADMDAEADIARLRAAFPRKVLNEQSLVVLRLTYAVLKRCAEAGGTLHDASRILSRNDFGEPSLLERWVNTAHQLSTLRAMHRRGPADEVLSRDTAEDDATKLSTESGTAASSTATTCTASTSIQPMQMASASTADGAASATHFGVSTLPVIKSPTSPCIDQADFGLFTPTSEGSMSPAAGVWPRTRVSLTAPTPTPTPTPVCVSTDVARAVRSRISSSLQALGTTSAPLGAPADLWSRAATRAAGAVPLRHPPRVRESRLEDILPLLGLRAGMLGPLLTALTVSVAVAISSDPAGTAVDGAVGSSAIRDAATRDSLPDVSVAEPTDPGVRAELRDIATEIVRASSRPTSSEHAADAACRAPAGQHIETMRWWEYFDMPADDRPAASAVSVTCCSAESVGIAVASCRGRDVYIMTDEEMARGVKVALAAAVTQCLFAAACTSATAPAQIHAVADVAAGVGQVLLSSAPPRKEAYEPATPSALAGAAGLPPLPPLRGHVSVSTTADAAAQATRRSSTFTPGLSVVPPPPGPIDALSGSALRPPALAPLRRSSSIVVASPYLRRQPSMHLGRSDEDERDMTPPRQRAPPAVPQTPRVVSFERQLQVRRMLAAAQGAPLHGAESTTPSLDMVVLATGALWSSAKPDANRADSADQDVAAIESIAGALGAALLRLLSAAAIGTAKTSQNPSHPAIVLRSTDELQISSAGTIQLCLPPHAARRRSLVSLEDAQQTLPANRSTTTAEPPRHPVEHARSAPPAPLLAPCTMPAPSFQGSKTPSSSPPSDLRKSLLKSSGAAAPSFMPPGLALYRAYTHVEGLDRLQERERRQGVAPSVPETRGTAMPTSTGGTSVKADSVTSHFSERTVDESSVIATPGSLGLRRNLSMPYVAADGDVAHNGHVAANRDGQATSLGFHQEFVQLLDEYAKKHLISRLAPPAAPIHAGALASAS